MCEPPCTHRFLCSLINDSWKSHLLFMHYSHNPCSQLMCIDARWVTLPPVGVSRGVLGLATAQVFTSFGACTKLLIVWLRGQAHLSYITSLIKVLI